MSLSFESLTASWLELAEPARIAITKAVAVAADAAITKIDSFWPATYGDTPTVEMLGVTTDSAGVRRAHFIAHATNYNYAQSGSDWANHYVMAGDVELGPGDLAGQVRLRMVVQDDIREADWESYRSSRVVEEERNKAIANLGATPPAPAMETIRIVRCPHCGGTDAYAIEHIFEVAHMYCGRCGYNAHVDDEQIKDEWNVKHDRRKDERSLPDWVPPLPSEEPGFERRGELLEHRGRGYSITIPDIGWSEGPDRAHSALFVAGVWVHVVVRADSVYTTKSLDETLREQLETAAQRRALAGSTLELLRAPLPPGADASGFVTYPRRVDDEDVTELLALTLKAKKPEYYDTVFVYVRFPPKHVEPFAWANLRAALLAGQSWVKGEFAPGPVWPAAGVYTEPKLSLGYTQLGSDRAEEIAEQLGAMTAEQAQRVSRALLAEANAFERPAAPWRAADTARVTQTLTECAGPELARLLVEHLGEVTSWHDFRGWCRCCAWAVDNRGRKRRKP